MDGTSCLSPIKMGPFQIIRWVGNLPFELEFPTSLRIHPVVLVVYLEQALNDPWQWLT
jgi:hypothetical protein